VGDTVYVLGGTESIGGDDAVAPLTRSVLKFDSNAHAWSEAAPMPRELANCGACELGSDIFVCGGFDGRSSADTFRYNTVTNVWRTLAPMPEAMARHSVCVLSGLIYSIGGHTLNVLRFDSMANFWSTARPMLCPRDDFVSFVLNGSIHVAGGFDGDDVLSSVERYDAASDSWEYVSGMALSELEARFNLTPERRWCGWRGLFDSLESMGGPARSQLNICREQQKRRTSSVGS
jgi:hypothetical protein